MSKASPREIERSLDEERMALAESLVELRRRLMPSVLVGQGKAALMAQARPLVSPLVSKVDGAVRAKPLAAAVAGLAVAALIFGRRKRAAAASVEPSAVAGTKYEALTRWEDEGGPPAPEPVPADEIWLSEAQGLRARAAKLLEQIDDAARRGLAPAAALARHRADVIAALARDTSHALGKGLESLTGTARSQALEARERLYLSRIAVVEKGRAAVEEHPLATGAVVAAAGALAAWLFPVTETEDRLLGEARDRLIDDLQRTAKSEIAGASDLARTFASALGRDIDRVEKAMTPQDAWSGTNVRH